MELYLYVRKKRKSTYRSFIISFCGLTMTGQSQRKAEQRPAALFRLFRVETEEPPHDPFVIRDRSHRRLHTTVLSGNIYIKRNPCLYRFLYSKSQRSVQSKTETHVSFVISCQYLYKAMRLLMSLLGLVLNFLAASQLQCTQKECLHKCLQNVWFVWEWSRNSEGYVCDTQK